MTPVVLRPGLVWGQGGVCLCVCESLRQMTHIWCGRARQLKPWRVYCVTVAGANDIEMHSSFHPRLLCSQGVLW